MDAYLSKPVSMRELLRTLGEVCAGRSGRTGRS
jgi:DNA-binding response OmpR family regulator